MRRLSLLAATAALVEGDAWLQFCMVSENAFVSENRWIRVR